MLAYSDIAPKKVVLLDDEPYEVLATSGVVKKQRQKPHNSAKLRNVITGATIEKTFSQADKIEEADIDERTVQYLFTNNKGESWFSEPGNPKERFSLPTDMLTHKLPFMRENMEVTVLSFDNKPFDVRIPIKVDLKVVEAPPNVKGNTSQGGTKQVTLETGLTVSVPLFIEADERIRVNTDTGTYVERA